MKVTVALRDGRIGRDPKLVDESGYGEVLATLELDHPINIDDVFTLIDGTEVKVIGYQETILPDRWHFDASVGEIFSVDQR